MSGIWRTRSGQLVGTGVSKSDCGWMPTIYWPDRAEYLECVQDAGHAAGIAVDYVRALQMDHVPEGAP